MDLVEKFYFALAILASVGIGDVLIKFKRPLILKICFLLILFSTAIGSLILAFQAIQFAYFLTPLKAIMTSCLLYIFYILYFKKLKFLVAVFSFIIIPISIIAAWYNYTHFDYHQIQILSGNVGADTIRNSQLPWFLPIIRLIFVVMFIVLISYIWYQIFFIFREENIYYNSIKTWTNFVFILSLIIVIANLTFSFIKDNIQVNNALTIIVYFYLTLLIIYRPDFINRSSLKIAISKKFNLVNFSNELTELNFINAFFSKVYYKNPEASLEHLSKQLGVPSNELYRFIYNNYSMSFNDLVNKNRISYFLDLVKKEEYKHYTIDALAKEVGFSSRQHLHKPFKKFHGGNPSDLIDEIHN